MIRKNAKAFFFFLVIYLYHLNYLLRTAFRGIYIVYVLVMMHNLLWQLF